MSAPKMSVMMTAEEFEDFVINFGCPECKTRVLHHPRCGMERDWESLVQVTKVANEIEKGREP